MLKNDCVVRANSTPLNTQCHKYAYSQVAGFHSTTFGITACRIQLLLAAEQIVLDFLVNGLEAYHFVAQGKHIGCRS